MYKNVSSSGQNVKAISYETASAKRNFNVSQKSYVMYFHNHTVTPNFSTEIRPNTLKYYNYTCNQCNLKLGFRHKQFLQVHHKNGDKNNNMMSNLELLCVECQ